MALTLEKIQALQLRTRRVPIPELDDEAIVREMSGLDRTLVLSQAKVGGSIDQTALARLVVAHALVDENGNRLITDDAMVSALPDYVFGPVLIEAYRLNGLAPDSPEKN